MTKTVTLLVLCVCAINVLAQKVMLSGVVTDELTGDPIGQATVAATGTDVTVVTNDEGFFTLKIGADAVPAQTDRSARNAQPKSITVSHVGYHSQQCHISAEQTAPLHIRLKPATVQLHELVVWTGDPRQLVNIAIKKIPENYSQRPQLYNCFYRETAMKRRHFIYVAEGVVDMFKTDYSRGTTRDRVAIRKGRRLLSPKQGDTLSVKVMGGPVLPVELDIAKNRDFLLNEEDLACYDFTMEVPEVIDGRMQYVVSLSPRLSMPYALYYGRLFIDHETLAFTRAELTLDMSDREKATRMMLVKKPAGVRFKPKELSCQIDYRYSDGVTYISYIRNTFRFNCDWRRRLFSTSFAAFCEMVVTDRIHDTVAIQPITGRTSFDQRDAFFDRVDYFQDPDFWQDYNIIEPTESLDKAIDRLVKKY